MSDHEPHHRHQHTHHNEKEDDFPNSYVPRWLLIIGIVLMLMVIGVWTILI